MTKRIYLLLLPNLPGALRQAGILFFAGCSVFSSPVLAQPSNFLPASGSASGPAMEMNTGAVFLGQTKKIRVPLSSFRFGSGTFVIQATTSCDCLVPETGFPVDITDRKTACLEFAYTPKETGEWNVEVILELAGEKGLEYRNMILSGVACDPAWRIEADEAAGLARSGKAQFIDLRSASAWQAARVQGSLHLRSGELLRSQSLKKRPLVLIGENLAETTVLTVAAQLRARGFFDVRVLSGGVAAWAAAGGMLDGADVGKAYAVAPWEVAASWHQTDWQMLHIGERHETAVTESGMVSLPAATTAAGLVSATSGSSASRFLVVTRNDADARSRLEKLPAGMRARVYYLEGGLSALDAQSAVRNGITRNPVPVTVQASSRILIARSGGCGGCGKNR
jgi:rhodanese-related sulfurtransferase